MNRHFCLRQKANEIIEIAQNDNSLEVRTLESENGNIWTTIKDQNNNGIFDIMDVPSDDVMLFQFNIDPRSRYTYYSEERKSHKFQVSYSGYPISSRNFYRKLDYFMKHLNTMGS